MYFEKNKIIYFGERVNISRVYCHSKIPSFEVTTQNKGTFYLDSENNKEK
mgnify:CR=1 FL=1